MLLFFLIHISYSYCIDAKLPMPIPFSLYTVDSLYCIHVIAKCNCRQHGNMKKIVHAYTLDANVYTYTLHIKVIVSFIFLSFICCCLQQCSLIKPLINLERKKNNAYVRVSARSRMWQQQWKTYEIWQVMMRFSHNFLLHLCYCSEHKQRSMPANDLLVCLVYPYSYAI